LVGFTKGAVQRAAFAESAEPGWSYGTNPAVNSVIYVTDSASAKALGEAYIGAPAGRLKGAAAFPSPCLTP